MRIAILGERPDDIAFYTPVVRRLLIENGFPVDSLQIVTDTVGTHILKDCEERTVYYFSKPVIDLAFYFSDHDNGVGADKIKKWKKGLEDAGMVYPIVLCFPNPHIEAWFCLEQDAVKRVFGLQPGSALVCHPEPKNHIHRLIEEDNDVTRIARDYYTDIGEAIDFSKLSNDPAFRNLRNDLKQVISLHGLNETNISLF